MIFHVISLIFLASNFLSTKQLISSDDTNISNITDATNNSFFPENGIYYEDDEIEEANTEEKESDKPVAFNRFKRVGDMLLPIAEFYSGVFTRQWTRSKTGLVFVFSKSFSKKEVSVLEVAVNDLANSSCIPIQLLNETEYRKEGKRIRNYAYISRKVRQGCYSNVGMLGGRQSLNLDPFGCINKGNALHEMIHTLGYEHEQSRPDRDQYVSINYKNILRGYEPNFWISTRSTTVGPYDFSSIMHYRADAFARNPRIPTITSKVPGKSIPLRNGSQLTQLDILKIKAITGCNQHSNLTSPDRT